MKKIMIIFIPPLLIIILIFLAVEYFNNIRTQKGALQVTSTPTSKVYLNDNYIGRTPISKTDAEDMIPAGEYSIKLVPLDPAFAEYNEKIRISTGILTVLDRKFRDKHLSEGYVITLTPLADANRSEIEVISFPSGSNVELDSIDIGQTPLHYKDPTDSDHMLNIKKAGYLEKSIRIRSTKGFRVSVVAYLGIDTDAGNIVDTDPADTSPTPPVDLTTSIASASPTLATSQILIMDTPTGFLRVRSEPSVNAGQITTVNPGESFALISENTDWYEIRLTNGKTGWVSNQYSKKQ